MTIVARGEFQPSARSIALISTSISARSYAARISASLTGGVRPDTASAPMPAGRDAVDEAGLVSEPLAVERCRRHVQGLVVECLGESALLEVAADDRHLVDRR